MSVMNTHAPVVLEQASEKPRRDADLHDRRSASERPTVGEMLGDVLPWIFAVPVAGPPVILLVGPLLFLVLLLIPPTALLITLLVVVLVGAGLLVALGALIASPYLLVRHLRARRPAHRRRFASVHHRARPAPAVSESAPGRQGGRGSGLGCASRLGYGLRARRYVPAAAWPPGRTSSPRRSNFRRTTESGVK